MISTPLLFANLSISLNSYPKSCLCLQFFYLCHLTTQYRYPITLFSAMSYLATHKISSFKQQISSRRIFIFLLSIFGTAVFVSFLLIGVQTDFCFFFHFTNKMLKSKFLLLLRHLSTGRKKPGLCSDFSRKISSFLYIFNAGTRYVYKKIVL